MMIDTRTLRPLMQQQDRTRHAARPGEKPVRGGCEYIGVRMNARVSALATLQETAAQKRTVCVRACFDSTQKNKREDEKRECNGSFIQKIKIVHKQ